MEYLPVKSYIVLWSVENPRVPLNPGLKLRPVNPPNELVPWRPALEKELGREVRGVMALGGNVDWSLGRKRGLGI